MTGDLTKFIAVELSNEDALLFKEFMANYKKIKFMVDNGVFDIRRGKIVLNFGQGGNLLSIEKTTHVYVKQS